MKKRWFEKVVLIFAILSFICSFISLQESSAQDDPNDPLGPDSVLFEKVGFYVFGPPYHGKAVISVSCRSTFPSIFNSKGGRRT